MDEELPDDISLLSSLSDPECCDAEDGKDKSDMPLHHPNSRVKPTLLGTLAIVGTYNDPPNPAGI